MIYLKQLSFFVHSQIRPVIFLCSFPLLPYKESRRSLDRRGEGFGAMDSKSLEAKRWITMAEKLLETGDFDGTQTFANRARESNPIIAEQILSVTETLLTAQSNPRDWNKLSFADQAFRFVSEAWNVLSNPSKKANYDNELRFLQSGQLGQQQPQLQQQQQPQPQKLFMQPQAPRRNEENHPGYGEEDNIEGNGFFEGLDEFLNSLPILSAVGDDKAKAT